MDEMRKEFEEWVRSRGGSVITRDGEYIESMTRLWLECWQAAWNRRATNPLLISEQISSLETVAYITRFSHNLTWSRSRVDDMELVHRSDAEALIAGLQARIAELEAGSEPVCRAMLKAAPAQPAGKDRIDAERYRWLANDCDGDKQDDFIRLLLGSVLNRAEFDAAIDAAMKGESK